VFFDSATTQGRASLLERAMRAGKHVYCEKPVAFTLSAALELVQLARKCGVKHGVVQDKLFLPGLLKLAMLVKSGFFGRILSVRGEFGYWVFEGDLSRSSAPRGITARPRRRRHHPGHDVPLAPTCSTICSGP
jgi:predicted dehydrogenase